MGSDENFHRAMMQRVQSGELQLGVSRMAGTNSGSIAYSRFWTLFPSWPLWDISAFRGFWIPI